VLFPFLGVSFEYLIAKEMAVFHDLTYFYFTVTVQYYSATAVWITISAL